MKNRWLLCVAATLLTAATALAQFTKEQKTEVLDEMDHVLTNDAFVPGVDLTKFKSFVESRKDKLDDAESPWQFADAVNGALKEFGLSHIQLMPGRMHRRGWGGGDANASNYAQQRYGFHRRTPDLNWAAEDSAVIRIPSFESGYDTDAVADLFDQAKDAKYMVIDLRGNPGGEVENMRQFLGLVLPSDTPVGTFVSRRVALDFAHSENREPSDPVAIAKWAHRDFRPVKSSVSPFKGKIAVLVDGDSASAAEIVADALRENRHSLIVGQPTMGAVLVSTFDQLSYGFRLQFPIGDYVSHDGLRLEGHPIKPDVRASGAEEIQTALAKLKDN